MKEADYINCSDLVRLRIAENILRDLHSHLPNSDVVFESLEKMKNSIVRKL